MLYFSELQNRRVYSSKGLFVGRLNDLIFSTVGEPIITKAVILSAKKSRLVKVSNLRAVDSRLILTTDDHEDLQLNENELYVHKNLIDKQVIDITGNKIVRVNDVVMGSKPGWILVGVDISFMGIMRWFGVEDLFIQTTRRLKINYTPTFISWADIHPLELARGKVVVKTEQKKLLKLLPEDLADHLEMTNIANIDKTLEVLPEDYAAEVIASLNLNLQNALFDRFTPEKAAKILELVDPDEIVDLLLTLPKEKSAEIVELLPKDLQKEVNYLLKVPKTEIGEKITSEIIAVPSDTLAKDIFRIIRAETGDFSFLQYVYVVNKQKQLVGVVSLHELALANLESPVYKFMTQNLVVAHLQTPQELVLKKMLKYQIQALPVVNKQKKLLGLIAFDDVAQELVEKIKL